MTAWNKTKEFKALQKAAYQKLKDSGFHDIEGGMEGHLLQQTTPTLSLGAAASEMHGRLSRAKGLAHGSGRRDPKGHEKWLDKGVVEHYDRGKAAYYNAAQYLATLLFRTNMSREAKYSCSMHSDGYGEPVIEEELGISRFFIRKHLLPFRSIVKKYLDTTDDT